MTRAALRDIEDAMTRAVTAIDKSPMMALEHNAVLAAQAGLGKEMP